MGVSWTPCEVESMTCVENAPTAVLVVQSTAMTPHPSRVSSPSFLSGPGARVGPSSLPWQFSKGASRPATYKRTIRHTRHPPSHCSRDPLKTPLPLSEDKTDDAVLPENGNEVRAQQHITHAPDEIEEDLEKLPEEFIESDQGTWLTHRWKLPLAMGLAFVICNLDKVLSASAEWRQ